MGVCPALTQRALDLLEGILLPWCALLVAFADFTVDGSCRLAARLFVVFISVWLRPLRLLGDTELESFGDWSFFLVEKRSAERTPLLSLTGLIFGESLDPGLIYGSSTQKLLCFLIS